MNGFAIDLMRGTAQSAAPRGVLSRREDAAGTDRSSGDFDALVGASDSATPTGAEADEADGTAAEALDAATARIEALDEATGTASDSLTQILSDLREALKTADPGDPGAATDAAKRFYAALSDLSPDLAPDSGEALDDTQDELSADGAIMADISDLLAGLIPAAGAQPLASPVLSLLGARESGDETIGATGSEATGSEAAAEAVTDATRAATATGVAQAIAPGRETKTSGRDFAGLVARAHDGDIGTLAEAGAADLAEDPTGDLLADSAAAPSPLSTTTPLSATGQTPATAESSAAAPAEPTRAQQRLATSVAQQIREVEFGAGQTRIELNPQGMGQIELDIVQADDGTLKVTVRAENPIVLDALRADRMVLSELMQDRGFSMQGGGPDFEQFGGNRRGQETPSSSSRGGTDETAEISETEPAAHRTVLGDGLIDLLT